jgi:hypothetical protein
MFSVDNFYDFFTAEYGHEKTSNLVMTYQPHGSKDLHNLEPFVFDLSEEFQRKLIEFKRIIMHDQEPLFLDYVDTYRKTLQDQKNLHVENHNQNNVLTQLKKHAAQGTVFEFMRRVMKHRPIICHSEKYSQDIETLTQQGFVTCYYWWHGMIARDWFRHWQHYEDLAVRDKSSQQRFLLYSRAFDGSRAYRKELLQHCEQHHHAVTRYNWAHKQINPDHSAKIDIDDAVNSAVHLVAETLFDTDKIYLTEKVFKPMVMSQPFVLFAAPGSLKYLRDYGFQTFDSCWDESYDCEIDSSKRMSKLLALIDHIANLSLSEFQAVYARAMPIIEHNRKRFFSTAFQDDLLLEMRTNMQQALLEQNQGH